MYNLSNNFSKYLPQTQYNQSSYQPTRYNSYTPQHNSYTPSFGGYGGFNVGQMFQLVFNIILPFMHQPQQQHSYGQQQGYGQQHHYGQQHNSYDNYHQPSYNYDNYQPTYHEPSYSYDTYQEPVYYYGLDGKDGKDGRDGYDGAPGARGPRGYRGHNGINGKDGMHGRDGIDGKDGKDGHDGVNGKDGERGPRGYQGEKGERGERGPRGYDGKDGITKVIYEYIYQDCPCEPCDDHEDNPTTVSFDISGDPILTVNAMNNSNGSLTIPSVLQGVNFSPDTLNEPISLLKDDSSSMELKGTYKDINGDADSGIALDTASIKFNGDTADQLDDIDVTVTTDANGELQYTVITEGDQAFAITADSPLTVGDKTFSIAERPDGPNGETALRAVVTTSEYELTFAARNPDGADSYLDMNVAEVITSAGDDAENGFLFDVEGADQQLGLADILNLGNGDNENQDLYNQLLQAS